jgi:hypothetical protein
MTKATVQQQTNAKLLPAELAMLPAVKLAPSTGE